MVVNKRKKNSRQRGSWTHGWGAKKKHRGSGHRGGKGMAGSGKRADQKKPSIWKNKYFGKYGFKIGKAKIEAKTINIGKLDELAYKLGEEKNGIFEIDLNKKGYDKLLGSGKITKKAKINVKTASASAIDKVKKAGGEVILPKKKEDN